jgi:hypothetical protein
MKTKLVPHRQRSRRCPQAIGSESRCRLIPVPLGAKIQPWHWWKTPELSMTEAEREYYHGSPLTGETLKASGKLYEVRIPNNKLSHTARKG